MKLYEFTVTDEFDLTKSEILESAKRTALRQSGFVSWADDYEVKECQEPERLATGEIRYYFEVEGEELDSSLEASESKTPT